MKKTNQINDDTLDVGQLLLLPKNSDKQKGKAIEALADDAVLKNALKAIIIPSIEYSDVPLQDCLADVLTKIRKYANRGLFPDLQTSIRFSDPEKTRNSKITLRLTNAPATEALRYVTALAQCNFSIDGKVIVINSLEASSKP